MKSKTTFAVFSLFATLLYGAGAALAGEANATIEGTVSCAKCDLGIADACSDALTVGTGDKAIHILLEQDGSAKTSEHLCSGTTEVIATGNLESRDGKPLLVVSGLKAKPAAAAAAPAPAPTVVTKTGSMSCAKCNLKIANSCSDVLSVDVEGTTVNYWLEEAGKAKTSQHKCSGSKPASVSGKIEARDGKQVLVVTSFE